MKWNVDHLPAFVAVAEVGGISAAARRLGEPKSTISRAISRLEDDIGLQLFVRGPRSLRLTHDGGQFYQHAIRILEQVEAASAELAGLSETPRGTLTVALPMAFGREIVGPHLAGFQTDFPDVRLDLRIGSGQPDLIRDSIDMAVIVGSATDSDLIQQRLIDTPLIWIAAPAIASALPENPTPDELASLIGAVETRYGAAPVSVVDGAGAARDIALRRERMMQVNDPILLREFVRANGGLSFAPDLYCRAAIREGSLVQVYPHLQICQESSLSLLFPGRRLLPKKAQVFMSFLRDICAGMR
ncbi:MAG: LysR family transcriptional regulator [Pseudomonadota bacterium]|nr:LysR family transcriptional regulator [Pseudomonadota bacterium]MEC8130273.1 LysR family transcriptional regulator [Pseudomonadota bacterium]